MGALPQGGRGLVFVGVLIIHIVLSGLFAGVGGAFWSRDQPSKEELEETEGREAPCSQQGSSSETEAFREGAPPNQASFTGAGVERGGVWECKADGRAWWLAEGPDPAALPSGQDGPGSWPF